MKAKSTKLIIYKSACPDCGSENPWHFLNGRILNLFGRIAEAPIVPKEQRTTHLNCVFCKAIFQVAD